MYRFLITLIVSLFLLTLAPSNVWAEAAQPKNYFFNLNSVNKITCYAGGDYLYDGTATVIGADRILTDAHVIYKSQWCTFNGLGTRVIYVDNHLDIAVLEAITDGLPTSKISCLGFGKGAYLAVGFAYGEDFVIEPLITENRYTVFRATDDKDFPFVSLHLVKADGHVFSGMSGGPVITMGGRVIGTVIGTDVNGDGLYRELRDTPICTPEGRVKMGLSEKLD